VKVRFCIVMSPLTPTELSSLFISIKVALTAVACSLPFAVLCAYVLARFRFVGHGILNVVVHLPLVLPPVVTGYVLLLILGRQGLIGAYLEKYCGITFAFRWTGAALAAGIMAFPLIVRSIRISIEAIDEQFENAARNLGGNRLRVFFSITLPLSYPGIMAGAVLGFAKALGEFGATITFVSNIPGETQTIPSAIYALTQSPNGEVPALRLAAISVFVSVIALTLSEIMSREARRR